MKKVLHIVGSLNQTTQLFEISKQLPEFEHYFTQCFGSSVLAQWLAENGYLDFTVVGTNSKFRKEQDQFIKNHKLKYDYRGESLGNHYDLVFFSSDLLVPNSLKSAHKVFVQEGMTDPISHWSRIVSYCKLPIWLTGDTSLNGTSNLCDMYCVASEGYAESFAKMGTDPGKIHITGIPNFDNAKTYLRNSLTLNNYVLVCTSDLREVKKFDNRKAFLRKCAQICGNREIIFKLHPNENFDRASMEIKEVFGPDVLIYKSGNTNELIANCEELITQFSSVVYIGMALGKKVHSYFRPEYLKRMMPIQNGGTSAKKIAALCREIIKSNSSMELDLKRNDIKHTSKPHYQFAYA